jgi:hypothetical protein
MAKGAPPLSQQPLALPLPLVIPFTLTKEGSGVPRPRLPAAFGRARDVVRGLPAGQQGSALAFLEMPLAVERRVPQRASKTLSFRAVPIAFLRTTRNLSYVPSLPAKKRH